MNQFKGLSSRKEESSVLEICDGLTARLVPTAAMESNLDWKCIVGLTGPPGAGKSTIASEVARIGSSNGYCRSSRVC